MMLMRTILASGVMMALMACSGGEKSTPASTNESATSATTALDSSKT